MARYEHLPIYREAFDLALYFEKTVRSMSRYDKYTLGTDLRNLSRSWGLKGTHGRRIGPRVPAVL